MKLAMALVALAARDANGTVLQRLNFTVGQ
jgi:hypothetical protein